MKKILLAVFVSLGLLTLGLIGTIFAQEEIVDHQENLGRLVDQGRAGTDPWVVSLGAPVSITSGTFTTTGQFEIVLMNFSVASGSGTAVFSSTGTLNHCSVVPPSDISIFDFDIKTNDADQFPVLGKRSLVGHVGLLAKRFLAGSHLAIVSNASPDGTYKARCVVLK